MTDRPGPWQDVMKLDLATEPIGKPPEGFYDTRALEGGIKARHAIGGTTVALDTSAYEQAM